MPESSRVHYIVSANDQNAPPQDNNLQDIYLVGADPRNERNANGHGTDGTVPTLLHEEDPITDNPLANNRTPRGPADVNDNDSDALLGPRPGHDRDRDRGQRVPSANAPMPAPGPQRQVRLNLSNYEHTIGMPVGLTVALPPPAPPPAAAAHIPLDAATQNAPPPPVALPPPPVALAAATGFTPGQRPLPQQTFPLPDANPRQEYGTASYSSTTTGLPEWGQASQQRTEPLDDDFDLVGIKKNKKP